jgi:hypothetical protein
LLPVPFALFNARRRRRLFDRQLNLDSLRALPWRDFELLVGEAYRRQGYQVIERGGAHPDGGIDLELRDKDKKLVVQCKRWQTRTVGVELVRELYGAWSARRRTPPSSLPAARTRPMRSTSPAINRSSSSMATRWLQCWGVCKRRAQT